MDLHVEQFDEFFGSLYQDRHGSPFQPMDWQRELARLACLGEWPNYICVPTGAGKTSALDVAVFALAVQATLPPMQRTAPMRTFLVVDRRTVVSEAFCRAQHIQYKLATAVDGILKIVADRLLLYTDGDLGSQPLAVAELRGGIYRDRNWCNSLTQPMVVASTVDQVGSRLMFRGYGVPNLSRSIQAAVVAHDSLVILDEAHISQAFSQTLKSICSYQTGPWSEIAIARPIRVVEMTATPTDATGTTLAIAAEQLSDPSTHIGRIVTTPKVTTLSVAEKAKGSNASTQIATAIVEQIKTLSLGSQTIVGVMCNMVATAKAVVELLKKNKEIEPDQVHLIIGSMRPIDREKQTKLLRDRISTGADRTELSNPMFVVATQCIEVGADYDFDVLVTEAAPVDSLIQRFGRLNRGGRAIEAIGHVVMRGDYVSTDQELRNSATAFKFVDPIYGNSTSHTWNWLQRVADSNQVDFGISSFKSLTVRMTRAERAECTTSSANSPVLLPAHVDLLSQTSEDPWPDPDVSLWLHGPDRNDPEVQICWRADLLPPVEAIADDIVRVNFDALKNEAGQRDVFHAISLCPPTSMECVSVPLRRIVSWLTSIAKQKRISPDSSSDIAQIAEDERATYQIVPLPFRPIAWRGSDKSVVIENIRDIRPGDTLVFSPIAGGWDDLCYISDPQVTPWRLRNPQGDSLKETLASMDETEQSTFACRRDDFYELAKIDIATEAFTAARRQPIARLHRNLLLPTECNVLFNELRAEGRDWRLNKSELLGWLQGLDDPLFELFDSVKPSTIRVTEYTSNGRPVGLVIKDLQFSNRDEVSIEDGDFDDSYSEIASGRPVELLSHLERVRVQTQAVAVKLALDENKSALCDAASRHDWGKADPRFQALLLGGDEFAASMETQLFAKSAEIPFSVQERQIARRRSKLPTGFRHEFLSLAIAEANPMSSNDNADLDLLLHLIASHHGYARPWAPLCIDASPPDVSLEPIGLDSRISSEERKNRVYHRVDSSVAPRFWRLTRKYGWWGLAMLETVLRLSDHRVSQNESLMQLRQVTKEASEVEEASV